MNNHQPQNLFELLTARSHESDETGGAVVWKGRELSWSEIETGARKVAGGLKQLGIEAGDRVAVMLPNVPPYIFVEFGVYLIGAILVPIHVLTGKSELGYLLDDSEAKVLVYWGDCQQVVDESTAGRESLRHRIVFGEETGDNSSRFSTWLDSSPLHEGEPVHGGDDIAKIQYTAGVTGRSKGVMLSHKNILYSSRETRTALKLLPNDRVLGTMPFFHPFGSALLLHMTILSGATLRIAAGFEPKETFESISSGECTVMIGLPMHFADLMDQAGSPGSSCRLRFAVSGGGPLDSEVRTRFESTFNTWIATIYGACETSPTIAVNATHLADAPRDAFGRAISGTDIRIVDGQGKEPPVGEEGEIVVRGPGVFRGYWNKPDALKLAVDDEGWFHTSDLGKMDLNGRLYGMGRLHDRINKGGYPVYPREVEQVLNDHPSIYASGVIGVDDKKYGEEIIAYVVPHAGQPVQEEPLIQYCAERLARFKVPRQVRVIDHLPRTADGTLLRRALREMRAIRHNSHR